MSYDFRMSLASLMFAFFCVSRMMSSGREDTNVMDTTRQVRWLLQLSRSFQSWHSSTFTISLLLYHLDPQYLYSRLFPWVQSDPEGSLWRDPPHYWEQIVFPAYVEANSELFENGDLEHGKPTQKKVENLILVEGLQVEISDVVERCCNILIDVANQ